MAASRGPRRRGFVCALLGSQLEHGGRARGPLQQLRDQIAHFFSIDKQPEGIAVRVDGWRTLQEALEVIADSRRRFDEQGG
jgi:hypothetical protein